MAAQDRLDKAAGWPPTAAMARPRAARDPLARIRRLAPTLLKRVLPRSLLGRSLLIIVTPLILLQVVSTWVFYDSHWETVTRRLAGSVAGDIAAVIAAMRDAAPEHYPRIFAIARETMQLEVRHLPDAILPNDPVAVRQNLVDVKLAEAMTELVGRPFLIDTRSFEKLVEVRVQLAEGVLQVTLPRRRLFSSTTYVFILWMVGTSLALFALATLFMRSQVRPIKRLAAAAEAFGKGREVPDFKIEGATEVRQAAAAFNEMRARIKRQIRQRTEMLAGVSHDLRTPITRMKLQLAMLGDGPEIADLAADVAEMEKMVEGYLAFARGEGMEQATRTDLGGLMREIVASALRDGAAIDLHVEEEILLPLRPHAFRRCVTNLLNNARRHARQVTVRVGRREGAAEIAIDDDGPGIPPDRREAVFKPFYRLEGSRNPATGGIGLGLTIARDVMRSHGGELLLGDSPAGGLRALLRLPL